jgi:hypothetical protein
MQPSAIQLAQHERIDHAIMIKLDQITKLYGV